MQNNAKGKRFMNLTLRRKHASDQDSSLVYYQYYLPLGIAITGTLLFAIFQVPHASLWLSPDIILAALLALSISVIFFQSYQLKETKKKLVQAEQKARVSGSRFDKVYGAKTIGLWFTSFDGTVVHANQAFLEMLGYTQTDLETGAINWKSMTPPEYEEVTQNAIIELKNTGSCQPFEKEYIKKDGSRVTVMIGSSALQDDVFADVVAYAIDITGIKASTKREDELHAAIIKQREEMLQIFMNAPAAIIIRRGPELELEFANHEALKLISSKQDDVVGKSTQDYLHKVKTTFNAETFKEVYRTGKAISGKSHHVKYDRYGTGVPVDAWFDFVLEPVYDEQGLVNGVATFCFDVSDLAKANQKLKLSDSRFRFIADAIPHKMWTSGPDGKANYFNHGWYEYLGVDKFDEVRDALWDSIHPEDLQKTEVLWQESIANGKDMELEQRFRRHDGVYLWHLTRASIFRDEAGEVMLWVGSCTNIHDQKTSEEALRASEAHFKALANSNSLLIWQIDDLCNMTYVNDTWRSYTGITTATISENDWLKNIHPDDRQQALDEFNEAFEKRRPMHIKYRFYNNQNGKYCWMLDNAHPVFNPNFGGYVGSMTDIDDQESAQRATQLLMQKKDEFFGIASHELKTPITSMKACLQMLGRMDFNQSLSNQKTVELVQRANKQVNKLTDIVNDLLDVTKIQSGKMQLNKTAYRFSESVSECLHEMQQYEPGYKFEIQSSCAATVVADRVRLEQVIINFLSNAIKYSPDHHTIYLNLTIEGQILKFSVTDKGIGIAADKQAFLFDRFFRVHDSSQKFSGLGLGLFICAEIIKQHNGTVGLTSEEGKGSTFWFTLPLPAHQSS